MRRISAHYVLPLSSPPLKHGIVVLNEKGIVQELIDTGGQLRETGELEFYNGVITPGFILPCYMPPPIRDDASFKSLDSWLRRCGVRGVGLIQGTAAHFSEKQESPVHYHTIIELCPAKDKEFPAFLEAVDTITHAWNEHQQACSISCCPKSWVDSDLLHYLLEYISTHQSILTLRQDKNFPADIQAGALNRAWNHLYEDARENPPPIPGHLILCGDSLTGEQITVPGLKTYRFPLSGDLRKEGGNTVILRELFRIQEDWPGAGLPEILTMYTTEAARTLFEEDRLGSIEVGNNAGLNLIGRVEYTEDGGIRLKKDSTLKVI